MGRRIYPLILIPAIPLAIFLVELFRSHGYEALGHPLWFALASLAAAAALPLVWLAYARALRRATGLSFERALFLDLWSYLPFAPLAAYFVPAVGRAHNVGTLLFLGVVALCAGLKVATLLYLRRARLEAVWARPWLAPGLIVALALLLRISLIDAVRLTGDEALFSHWGLEIATGRDLFLKTEIVDKPPVFFYTQALFFLLFGPTEAAARLPSLIASVAGVFIVHELARQLFDRRAAALSALFLAVSPFDIQYAITAYTDPLMVTLALASCLLALRGRYLAAGLAIGLSTMTKQTGVFFLPLVLFCAFASQGQVGRKPGLREPALGLGGGFAAVVAAVFFWDFAVRVGSLRFLDVGQAHYGGFGPAAVASIGPRFRGWLEHLQYITASPALNALLLAGAPALLSYGVCRRRTRPGWRRDWAVVGFVLYFVALHVFLSFSLWDRYLLGLAPILALLLGRVVLLPYDALLGERRGAAGRVAYGAIVGAFLLATLLPPARVALRYGFPVGGDDGESQGIEEVAAWFRGNAPKGAVIFHKHLGWQYSFYMFDLPVQYYHYTTPEYLLDLAQRLPPGEKYVAFPSWVSPEALRRCLESGGWELRELYRVYRANGTVSFTIYRVQPQLDTLSEPVR